MLNDHNLSPGPMGFLLSVIEQLKFFTDDEVRKVTSLATGVYKVNRNVTFVYTMPLKRHLTSIKAFEIFI
jgi:hypothetical protein